MEEPPTKRQRRAVSPEPHHRSSEHERDSKRKPREAKHERDRRDRDKDQRRSRSPERRNKERYRDRDRERDRHGGRDGNNHHPIKRERSTSRDHRDRQRASPRPDGDRPRVWNKATKAATAGVTNSDDRADTIHPTDSKARANGSNDKDASVDDDEIRRIMGFGRFRSTKNTKVPGNQIYGVRKEKKVMYRQYMNRVGGFNRPLSPGRN